MVKLTIMRYFPRTGADEKVCSPATDRRRAGRSRGASVIEFAMVAPLFFLLFSAIIDFGRLFFVQMTLQDALRDAARYASTGVHQSGTNPATGQPYTRELSIQNKILNEAAAAGVKPADVTINISSVKGGVNNAGNPMDTVTISVTENLQLITGYIAQYFMPNGKYVFTLSISFKNESFSPNCGTPPYTGC